VLHIPHPKNPHKTKINMVRLRQLPAKVKGGKHMENTNGFQSDAAVQQTADPAEPEAIKVSTTDGLQQANELKLWKL
jgi:hypothetical protein